MTESVRVHLTGTYGLRDRVTRQVTYFGPGDVQVPVSLARALGFDVDRLLAEQTGQPEDEGNTVEEPTLLPEGFPHADVLSEHGIHEVGQVPTTEEGLTALAGIGKKRARDILAALTEV